MKIITLYSDVDDFIITCFVGLTVLMFIVNWVYLKIKEQRKKSLLNFSNLQDDNGINVNEYALNFKHDIKADKSIGITAKMVLVIFSFAIIVMPLHEFVVTLRPIAFFQGWTCFPF